MSGLANVLRRRLLVAGGALAAFPRVYAQSRASTVHRLAVFHAPPPFSEVVVDRLRDFGFKRGENLEVDIDIADLPSDKLIAAAVGIATRRPDVIVAGGSESVLDAIKRAAPATPIVMVFVDFDPVATGHIRSLSHPGGNVTGVYLQQVDLAGKRLELLKEAVPAANRMAVLFDAATRAQLRQAEKTASALRVTLLPQQLHDKPYAYDAALSAAVRERAEAVLILSSGEFFLDRFRIIELIGHYRLPSMATIPFADAGALLCYGASFLKMFAMAADYVQRILRGAKPADLAVEQPSHFDLVVNLQTARRIGVHIPQSLLLRADEVIR